jgi:N6-L-threonylcarbamoyladenine synthase
MVNILGIESSCDETSASICQNGVILNNIIATQTIHQEYGGVVPELASRAHQKNIVPIITAALERANLRKEDLNGVACTQGPGLLGALLVGYTFAKSMAFALNIPMINVHHMKAHILAHFIEPPIPTFPFLCLTVSGGHTQIVKVNDFDEMQVLGSTTDDAVGEAFDKGAKILGLDYPGGPLIDQYAKTGDPNAFTFAESEMEGYNFSFSGIKTSLLYGLKKLTRQDPQFVKQHLPDLCASYQKHLINMLVKKLHKASSELGIKEIAIAGGVAANSSLRRRIEVLGNENGWNVFIPKFEYCTDNAAMIAISGHYLYQKKEFAQLSDGPKPRMPF